MIIVNELHGTWSKPIFDEITITTEKTITFTINTTIVNATTIIATIGITNNKHHNTPKYAHKTIQNSIGNENASYLPPVSPSLLFLERSTMGMLCLERAI